MSCSNFSLQEPKISLHNNNTNIEIEKLSKIFSTEFINKLTEDQRQIFDYIINSNKENMFYIDGSGGSGKTFLYKTLIYYFISIGKKLLSLAWTGIASILLSWDITSHNVFKLPLDLSNTETVFF